MAQLLVHSSCYARELPHEPAPSSVLPQVCMASSIKPPYVCLEPPTLPGIQLMPRLPYLTTAWPPFLLHKTSKRPNCSTFSLVGQEPCSPCPLVRPHQLKSPSLQPSLPSPATPAGAHVRITNRVSFRPACSSCICAHGSTSTLSQ